MRVAVVVVLALASCASLYWCVMATLGILTDTTPLSPADGGTP